jgi:hypothetical protein
MEEWVKCWLVKRQLPSQDLPTWLITTSQTRSVSLFGETDTGFSLSTYVPGQVRGKSHTIYLNDINNSTAKLYIANNADSNQFFMCIPKDTSLEARVITVAEYQELHTANQEQPALSAE